MKNYNYYECPYCGSENIECNGYDVDEDAILNYMTCADCGKKWINDFRFNGIIFDGDEEDNNEKRKTI